MPRARTLGVFYAYDSTLTAQWSTYATSAFCASAMALPTIAHAEVFIPAYATTSTCPSSGANAASGIIVYK
jgi:hypothetical protein